MRDRDGPPGGLRPRSLRRGGVRLPGGRLRPPGHARRKNLWSFSGDRIAVRFQYESHDAEGQWWRSYGNELWEFAPDGLMARREASINDRKITPAERRIFGPRPAAEHGQDFPLW